MEYDVVVELAAPSRKITWEPVVFHIAMLSFRDNWPVV